MMCSGSSNDWESTYRAHAQRLTRLAVLLVGEADAHDLVADAMWKAVTSRTWPTATERGAYLTRSLVNLAHDRRRQIERRQRRERAVATRAVPSTTTTNDTDRSIIVRDGLDSLSPSQLSVVFLHYWDDLTLEQVASELGLSVGTVRSHLDRAKRRLRPLFPDFESEYRR